MTTLADLIDAYEVAKATGDRALVKAVHDRLAKALAPFTKSFHGEGPRGVMHRGVKWYELIGFVYSEPGKPFAGKIPEAGTIEVGEATGKGESP